MTEVFGDLVEHSFDNAGRTTGITDWLSNTTSFGYDHNSNLTSEALPNGDSSTVTVNHDDQITAISDAPTSTPSSPFATFIYTRNADQQVATESDTGVPTPTSQTYGYDPLKRVASDSSGSYAYNVGGDPTTLANGTSQTFATNGQLTDSVDSGSHHTTYGYNSRGDRTSTTLSGSTVALAYDQDDRLISYGSSAAYTYNGDGLRASKTVSSTTEAFTWDGNTRDGIPHVLVDGSTSYVYDPVGHPLEQITSGGSVTYYLHDQLGSTRLLRSSSGTTTASYTYDSYGGPAGSTGTATNPLRYVGSYTDTESGLIYLINRYYDPSTAVFLSVDPLVVVTQQPYDYVGQDPINGYDPTGAVNEEVGAYMAGGRQGGDAGTGEGGGVGAGRGVEPVPIVPEYTGGHAQGVLEFNGERIRIESGRKGPAANIPLGTPGFDAYTRTHVEGHAAAIMRAEGVQEAALYINKEPCLNCDRNLPK